MAFDYGSIDLGLKNPFKKEGVATASRGLIQLLAGVYLLIQAASHVKSDVGVGWILVAFGVFLLAAGVQALGGGIYSTLKYFVGRNHPTSLATNYSKSEKSNVNEEDAAYSAQEIEEMLVGRKNTTFLEPTGFLARLLHSIFPKLLFMPYPIRNMAQRIFGAWVKTLVAFIAFALVSFVTLAGFVGEAGKLIFPIYSAMLMIYISLVWFTTGRAIPRGAERNIETLGSGAIVKVVTVSIFLPVLIGVGLSWLMDQGSTSASQIESVFNALPDLNATVYLICLFIAASICTAVIGFMLRCRIANANPSTEVSELRENWQESVHPNEIFINLDNLVMANRRYKEVPNRVYRELDPNLEEQIEGKGAFKGELIQEIQPKVKALSLGTAFENTRFAGLIFGNILHIIAIVLTFVLAYSFIDIYTFLKAVNIADIKADLNSPQTAEFLELLITAIHFILITFLLRSFAKLLTNSSHLFYAEIQFESLLVYFKCEGTFTESKISTGTGIHDSTRSENILVRSSITPWIVATRIVTTTFAATGMKNLEFPRYILEMHKAEDDLQAIKDDVIGFLKNRESIASITSERDLGNTSQIHQLNQQTRALNDAPQPQKISQDDEAAGYLRQEEDMERKEEDEK